MSVYVYVCTIRRTQPLSSSMVVAVVVHSLQPLGKALSRTPLEVGVWGDRGGGVEGNQKKDREGKRMSKCKTGETKSKTHRCSLEEIKRGGGIRGKTSQGPIAKTREHEKECGSETNRGEVKADEEEEEEIDEKGVVSKAAWCQTTGKSPCADAGTRCWKPVLEKGKNARRKEKKKEKTVVAPQDSVVKLQAAAGGRRTKLS